MMTLANRKQSTRSTAAALPPTSCVVGALLILMGSPPAAAMVECQAHKGSDRAYWSWREIEGRRCWYRGHRGMNKQALHWPATPPRQPAPRRPVVVAADASAVLGAEAVDTIGDRWPDVDWTEMSLRLFEEVAAVTAAPSRRVPNTGADADANLDRRHKPATPNKNTGQGRSPAVVLAVLMVGLGMIGAGAFIIKMRT